MPPRLDTAFKTKAIIIALLTLLIAGVMIATGDGSGASELTGDRVHGSPR